jgi:polysaccharide biosynthesis protein PslG
MGRSRRVVTVGWAVAAVAALVLSGGLLIAPDGVPRGAAPDARASPSTAAPVPASGSATTPVRPVPWSSQALGVAPASSAPVPPARDARAGVAIPGVRLLYTDPAPDLDRVAALGVGWVRFDAAWSEIEIDRGAFDWSRLDGGVTAARDRGLSVLLILGTTARWARPAGADWNHGPDTPEQRAGFAAFASRAVERYRGDVAAWEVWNEPNLPIAWAPAPDPDAYHALLAAAYRAIHAADPAALVISGGTGGGPTGVATLDWYRALYDLGLREVCDAVAVHPYPDAPDPDSGEMAAARRVRALMDARGDRETPLWGTETGAPTGGAPSIGEPAQAVLLRALYARWEDIPGTGPLLYYTLRDFGGADREGHFGLLRADGAPKAAYDALRDRSGA